MKRYFSFFLTLIFSATVTAEVNGRHIEYTVGDVVMSGYLAFDDHLTEKRPGVLVVHEWWGHNEYARKRAEMLASLGYVAFALDMYGKGKVTTHPEDAKKFMQQVTATQAVAQQRFDAAFQLLTNQPNVQPTQIAAIGYCFGGGVVLSMARAGKPLQGVVSFHGSLKTDHPATGQIQARVLVFNGTDDPFVTKEHISAFKQEMARARADYRIVHYPGVKHGFTNPGADAFGQKFNMPLAYDAHADQDSWAQMQQFLAKIFE